MTGSGANRKHASYDPTSAQRRLQTLGGAVVTRVIPKEHSPRALGAAAGLPKSDFDRILLPILAFLTSDDPTLIFLDRSRGLGRFD